MWGRSLLLGLVLVVGQAGCSDELGDDEKRVTGTVRDRLSGAAIAGATVTFTADTLERESSRTDSDGKYEITVITESTLGQVRAEHPSYQPADGTVFFDTPERTVDLTMLARP